MSATTKLKWKKLITQLKYMYEELDIVKTMSEQAGTEFQKYYEDFCEKNDINRDELNSKHKERLDKLYSSQKENNKQQNLTPAYSGSTALSVCNKSSDDESPKQAATSSELIFANSDEKELHEVFSKLFRKLATVLHPDKLDNSGFNEERKKEMSQMFTKARRALEEKKYFTLIDYAESLNIPTPKNYKQQISWMKKEADEVRRKIAAVTRTYNYSFAETETDEQRDALIEKFIKQVFGITVPKKE